MLFWWLKCANIWIRINYKLIVRLLALPGVVNLFRITLIGMWMNGVQWKVPEKCISKQKKDLIKCFACAIKTCESLVYRVNCHINMMDVGMYGSEHTAHHSSGYQSAESMSSGNGYAYYPNHHHHHLHHHHFHPNSDFLSAYPTHNNSSPANTTPPSTSSNSSSAMYHPHLYSPTAAEYGITTSSNQSPAETTAFFETDNVALQSYYVSGQTTSNASTVDQQQQSSASNGILPETHIISSDNGLSYTNLDYMYGPTNHTNNAMYLHGDDKSTINHYNSLGADSTGVHLSQQHHPIIPSVPATVAVSWQPHHNPGYLETAHSVAMNCIPTGGHSTNGSTGRGLIAVQTEQQQHQQQQHQNAQHPHHQQQQQQQQPTYKWMQVKRNVPKPQGKRINQIKWISFVAQTTNERTTTVFIAIGMNSKFTA